MVVLTAAGYNSCVALVVGIVDIAAVAVSLVVTAPNRRCAAHLFQHKVRNFFCGDMVESQIHARLAAFPGVYLVQKIRRLVTQIIPNHLYLGIETIKSNEKAGFMAYIFR